MRHFTRLLILPAIIAAMALTGCSSHKNSAKTKPDTSETVIETPVQINNVAESYLLSLRSTYAGWQYLSVPVEIEFTSPKNLKVSGRLYMERDKSIYLSMRVLGMEVATVYVTNDMIYATEKLHKYYVAESISDLLAGSDFTVGDLQNLLLGRAFIGGRGLMDQSMASDVKITTSDDGTDWWITPPETNGVKYEFDIAPNPQHVRTATFMHNDVLRVKCNYTQPTRTKGGMIANKLTFKIFTGGTRLQLNANLNLKDVKWGEKDINSWKMPKGYKQLSRKELLNM
ncbi:MAG: DUF4292 domain-containing protein, partial [Muribaculaceae bacterium]|nr:DUF4292 domain-containing protein [Muribaculaceae bacterium]